MKLSVPLKSSISKPASYSTDYPSYVDWRLQNAVTSVKNQGSCGSCWAFSAAGAIEGLLAIRGKPLVSLSQQQFVDCSKSYGNQGCNGGWMDFAYAYAMKHAIVNEESYPYQESDRICQYTKLTGGITITGYEDVLPGSADALIYAISHQPVSIAVDATSWQHYSSGIITSNCGVGLNHGVLVVGYSLNDNVKYWIIKNSWGPYWGERGFLKVAITGDGAGLCGVQIAPSYPTIIK